MHRSVYLPLLRGLTPRSLEVFDFAEQGMVTGSRDTTTVAPQALYLLNDPFVRQQSLALAERLLSRTDLDDAGRIHLAYRLTLGRTATAKEIERVQELPGDYEAASQRTSRAGAKPMPNGRPPGQASARRCSASAEFRYRPADRVGRLRSVLGCSNATPCAADPSSPIARIQPMMNPQSVATAIGSRLSRRQVLKSASAGFGYLALAGMLGQNAAARRRRQGRAAGPLAPEGAALPGQGQADHLPVHGRRRCRRWTPGSTSRNCRRTTARSAPAAAR